MKITINVKNGKIERVDNLLISDEEIRCFTATEATAFISEKVKQRIYEVAGGSWEIEKEPLSAQEAKAA
jgi:hypothetical protein